MYNNLSASLFTWSAQFLLINPSKRFALAVLNLTWLVRVKSLVTTMPRSLTDETDALRQVSSIE